jgi:hypothetical protein
VQQTSRKLVLKPFLIFLKEFVVSLDSNIWLFYP